MKQLKVSDLPVTASAIDTNRQTINMVSNWLPDLEKSYFDYGIPQEIRNLINQPINDEPIYTDIITHVVSILEKVNYLELGVSVGKNFLPIVNAIQQGRATAFDIENINPLLAEYFDAHQTITNWPSPNNSIRKENATVTTYRRNEAEVCYLAADIFDENAWQYLAGQQFNIIFSDALHDPKALLFEYNMIRKHKLLAKDFVFFWDDLHGKMFEAFASIGKQIKRQRFPRRTHVFQIDINGWLGQNWPIKHPVGIVSSFDFTHA